MSYQDLLVWQKAMDLATESYRVTQAFPKSEVYGLTAQIRRSCNSVPSNIAEGQGRQTRKEFVHFLGIAQGSLRELETQILLGFRVKYLSSKDKDIVLSLSKEVGILLARLIKSLA